MRRHVHKYGAETNFRSTCVLTISARDNSRRETLLVSGYNGNNLSKRTTATKSVGNQFRRDNFGRQFLRPIKFKFQDFFSDLKSCQTVMRNGVSRWEIIEEDAWRIIHLRLQDKCSYVEIASRLAAVTRQHPGTPR